MSFGEFYTAGRGLFDAYKDGADKAEAARLLDQQLTAALSSQQGQAAPSNGLTALGAGSATQPQVSQPMAPLGAQRVPSFAGGSSVPLVMPGSGGENETKFVGALKEGGLTNPYGLGALAAYASRESGYKGSNIAGSWSDPSESGAPGVSGGILSWRGDRFANMRRYTAGAQDPVVAQAKYALVENPELTLALQRAKSPEEANGLLAQAWRFAGWNRQGGENAARLDATRAYVAKLGGAQPGAQATQVATVPSAGASAPRMAGMPPPQMPQAETQQAAQGGDNPADMPVPNAQPAGFQIPGEAPQSDFVPGTVASPAIQSSASQGGGGMGLAPAAAQRISPEQVATLRAMVRNPYTQGYATKIIEGLNKPSEFSFQVVGDQLIRTSKDGRAEVVPNITKPATLSVVKGSDGNDYVFNPQTGAMSRAIEGRDKQFTDLTTPEERTAAGIPANYTGPVQRGPNGELKLPGKASTEVNIDQKGETAFSTTANTAIAKRFEKLSEEGDAARTDSALLGQLRGLGTVVGTGPMAAAQSYLADKGIKLGDNVGAVEAYGAIIDKMVPAQRIPGSGTTSDFDAKGFKSSLPNLMKTPEGNSLIINTLDALNNDKIARARIAEQALTGEIKPQEAVRQLRALPPPNIVFKSGLADLARSGKLSGAGTIDPASAPPPNTPAPQLKPMPADTLTEARDAIRRGAPAAKVIERLRSQGYDASAL